MERGGGGEVEGREGERGGGGRRREEKGGRREGRREGEREKNINKIKQACHTAHVHVTSNYVTLCNTHKHSVVFITLHLWFEVDRTIQVFKQSQ